ncbi:hypothetical protein ACE6H2_014383 [Prunus campanulata]
MKLSSLSTRENLGLMLWNILEIIVCCLMSLTPPSNLASTTPPPLMPSLLLYVWAWCVLSHSSVGFGRPTEVTPVGENATLTFGTDGNLVLADADDRVAWQTNTANKGVVGFKLLKQATWCSMTQRVPSFGKALTAQPTLCWWVNLSGPGQ